MSELTADALRAILSYDPNTGQFHWLRPTAYKVKPGDKAGGRMKTGHIRIRIAPGRYGAHRLAWLHHYGEWPASEIDHIDGDPGNNRIANLRQVSHALNMQNRRLPPTNSTTKLLGVSWCPRNRKWRACISINGKNRWLGMHATPELAHQRYVEAKRELHPGNTL